MWQVWWSFPTRVSPRVLFPPPSSPPSSSPAFPISLPLPPLSFPLLLERTTAGDGGGVVRKEQFFLPATNVVDGQKYSRVVRPSLWACSSSSALPLGCTAAALLAFLAGDNRRLSLLFSFLLPFLSSSLAFLCRASTFCPAVFAVGWFAVYEIRYSIFRSKGDDDGGGGGDDLFLPYPRCHGRAVLDAMHDS